jgi:acyl-[acyl carrier protein]--UDP-N-acetylglucosamine O-acyltransferase
LELKKLYQTVFRSDKLFRAALAGAAESFTSAAAKTMLEFLASAKRGLCSDSTRGGSPEETE